MSKTRVVPPPFIPIIPIIGRDKEKAVICDAIKSGERKVIYFVGPGGIGKTYLLREIGKMQEDTRLPSFVWSDLIDLYHADFNSPDGIKEAIANRIDPKNKFFQKFHQLRRDYYAKQEEGVGGRDLEILRLEVDKQFQRDYAKLADQQRIVISFDTIELLQYESDIVQEVCELEEVSTVVKQWILQQTIKFPNTVIIFASRPHSAIEKDIHNEFKKAGWHYSRFQISELTQDETYRYLHELIDRNKELKDIIASGTGSLEGESVLEWVFRKTEGRPIRISLLVFLLLLGQAIGGLFRNNGNNEIDYLLIEKMRELPDPYGQIIHYLFLARKGLDIELLKYLAGNTLPEKQLEYYFEAMKKLAFIKTREDTLFLHDQMYDMHDTYFLNDPNFALEHKPLVQYFRNKLMNKSLSGDERRKLMVVSLYYELQFDPNEGYYNYYARWDEEAIRSSDIDLDMELRDEGLQFMNRYTSPNSPYYDERVYSSVDRIAIDRDCAVRWVERYIAQGDVHKAYRVAKKIRFSKHETFAWKKLNALIYKAGLNVAWGEAILYSSPDEADNAKIMFEDAIQFLSSTEETNPSLRWRINSIRGIAHNNLGYLYWSQGHYGLALNESLKSFTYFESEGLELELANVKNNVAYFLALLGRVNLAERHGRQALEIRKKIGQKYPLALSHSTLGLVYILKDSPSLAEKHTKKALEYLKDVNQPRGYGLVYLTFGLLLRKRGNQWKLGVILPKPVEKDFKQALNYYEQAESIFSQKNLREPLRIWEIANEKGSLFCDWGWQIWHQIGKKNQAVDLYKKAIRNQIKALKIASKFRLSLQVLDSKDDLAQAHGDLSFLLFEMGKQDESMKVRAKAENFLQEIENEVPSKYFLQESIGFQELIEPGEAYWQSLGKLYLWRSIWIFRDLKIRNIQSDEKLHEALRFSILSTIYFHRFWPQSYALGRSVNYFSDMLELIRERGKTTKWVYDQVNAAEKEFNIELDILKQTIDDVMGL